MLINFLWVLCVFTGTLTVSYLFLRKYYAQMHIRMRLTTLKDPLKVKTGMNLTDFTSIIFKPLKNLLLRFTPRNLKIRFENIIDYSGAKWEIGDFLLLKLVFAFVIFLVFLFFSRIISKSINPYIFLILAIIGFSLPDFYLLRRIQKRRKEIKHVLPPFIDYLTISVEAGLGLDLALARVIKQIDGPLAQELAYTLTEIKYGKTKLEAFKNLAKRLNIPEFTTFITALINAEQFGVSLGNILHIQGQQMREKRKQSIQEQAYKIPVKLVFPLILFILPGLFIVILGPAVIQVFKILF